MQPCIQRVKVREKLQSEIRKLEKLVMSDNYELVTKYII
jgi:hypothetical protein